MTTPSPESPDPLYIGPDPSYFDHDTAVHDQFAVRSSDEGTWWDPFDAYGTTCHEAWNTFEENLGAPDLTGAAVLGPDSPGPDLNTVTVAAALDATAMQVPYMTAALHPDHVQPYLARAFLDTGLPRTAQAGPLQDILADIAAAHVTLPTDVYVPQQQWPLDPAIPNGLSLPAPRPYWPLDPAIPDGLSLPVPSPATDAAAKRPRDETEAAPPPQRKRKRRAACPGAPDSEATRQWLLSAALSEDTLATISERSHADGFPMGRTRVHTSISLLGLEWGLRGTAGQVRPLLRVLRDMGHLSDPGVYRSGP